MSSSPGDAPALPVSEVDAELVLWRVFGLNDVYEDRPQPAWSVTETRGPGAKDNLTICVGDVPEELVLSIRQWDAQKTTILDANFGGTITYGEAQERYLREMSAEVPESFCDPYPLWFTMRLSRPTRKLAIEGVEAGWVASDPQSVAKEMTDFQSVGNRYLDGTLARLTGVMHPWNLGELRFPGRRVFLTAPHRAAWMQPNFSMTVRDSGVHIGRTGGWKTAPTTALAEALSALPSGQAFGKLTAGAAEWFTYAQAESDDLRRFVFAFAGLELLATQVEKDSRTALLQKLAAAAPEVPFKELLWPSKGDDWAERNLLFRAAAMTTTYSPATAIADTATCRNLAKTRNNLFHGVESGEIRTQSVICKELLRRYLGLVAAKEAGT